jgi:membrane peptidoglycan carboxypeptidase
MRWNGCARSTDHLVYESAKPGPGGGLEFTTRNFVFGDGLQAAQHMRIEFTEGKVSLLKLRSDNDLDVPLLQMEPPIIGGIYPGHNEDRALLKFEQLPKPLIDALIAVEDRKFYTHWASTHAVSHAPCTRLSAGSASKAAIRSPSSRSSLLQK